MISGELDGVICLNHGAGVSEEHPDMEGTFVSTAREIVGPNVSSLFRISIEIAALSHCFPWKKRPFQ